MTNQEKYNFKKIKLITLTILSFFLISAVLFIHPLGEPKAVKMDNYFIKNAQKQTGANNVVSSIVFDYRGLDTLGEAAVLFTAVLGISLIFVKKDEQNN